MSNAMRMGKRTLAGVAAGALGLALIPFVGATAVNAAPSVSAQAASGAGTVSPVRFTGTAGTRNTTIPSAFISFNKTTYATLFATNPTATLLSAPTATAKLFIDDSLGAVSPTNNFVQLGTLDDTTMAAGQYGVGTGTAGNGISTDDSFLRVGVDTAGAYTGRIANGTDTVTFSFTTTGAPTSMTLTPATSSISIGGTQNMLVTLLDTNGNLTQPTTVDSVSLTATRGSIAGSPVTTSSDAFTRGVGAVVFTGASSAGTATITASPLGTLTATGVTAQTASVTESGAVADDTVVNLAVTTPANAINTVTAPSIAQQAQVPAGTTTVTITVDDTTSATVGRTLRFKATASAGTVNGTVFTTSVYTNVTTDANRQATLTYTLGGAATAAEATLTVDQVLANDSTAGLDADILVTQKQPTVVGADVTVSPDDTIVAQLGSTTNVTVSVDDSFGTAQAGWTVQARRTSDSGTLLSSAVTNSSGEAVVSVTNASTTVAGGTEVYYFVATPPVGSPVTSDSALWISYSATGDITSLSLDPNAAAATECSNSSCTILVTPLISPPTSGSVYATGSTAASTSTYTIATATPSAAPTSNWAEFTVTTSPSNATVVTTPDGVYVSSAVPTSAKPIAWNAGTSTATISAGAKAYIWGTKAGMHDITFTSGQITLTAKVFIANTSADAYNIALTPTSQNVVKGGIGSATLTVTDVFGNPVQTSTGSSLTDDTGVVALVATGELLLAGFNTNLVAATGVDGTVRVAFIAGNASGEGSITATPLNATSTSKTPAWAPAYIPPVGAPAPALTSVAEVKVGSGPDTTSIVIEGSRANRAIIVDGSTSGIAAGTTVRPWIKFPGETQYTQGAASRQIVAVGDLGAGEFTWTRQTSKKTYVYFRTEDGTSQSLRVIIPGR